MSHPAPITSIETLPSELLEWLGEKKIKPGDGDEWVPSLLSLGFLLYGIERDILTGSWIMLCIGRLCRVLWTCWSIY